MFAFWNIEIADYMSNNCNFRISNPKYLFELFSKNCLDYKILLDNILLSLIHAILLSISLFMILFTVKIIFHLTLNIIKK